MSTPVVEIIQGIHVVRDDLMPGGTKARVAHLLFGDDEEYVYASPVYGYAQIALARAAAAHGKLATVFCAKRNQRHARTVEAANAGAKICEVGTGYLAVVQARARDYCSRTGARLLPFGFDTDIIRSALVEVARSIGIEPAEVWSVAGSGMLSRALQVAWPKAEFHAVQVGKAPNVGRAKLHLSQLPFEKDATRKPPFPSCSNYDAKAWVSIIAHARPGALFWNVAA